MKIAVLFSVIILFYCSVTKNTADYKQEVMQTELAFARMAREQGIRKAFLTFAADSAVINRSDKILKRKNDFSNYFSKEVWNNAQLEWQPDFIEVSASGDLAYTYGSYTFSSKDSSGVISTSNGIFHTVWKRQNDGSWKFVWD